MAYFSNVTVKQTYASPHSKNAWLYLDSIGWRKISQDSTDGVTNTFIMGNDALVSNRTVSGSTDSNNQIEYLYLN